MENPGHLIIGAECGVEIGTGHVMRCLALAQRWNHSGGRATFLIPSGSPGIEQRIMSEGFSCEALATEAFTQSVVDRMVACKPGVAVLDGYGFGCREQSALDEAGISTLIVRQLRACHRIPGALDSQSKRFCDWSGSRAPGQRQHSLAGFELCADSGRIPAMAGMEAGYSAKGRAGFDHHWRQRSGQS